ncbi:MAG: aldehyde dehydrogenase family protein [Myxococcota bacterium]|nr:aldehyde dehydrogenase family protein [Myxococcota bacterium]
MTHYQMYINGKFVDAVSGETVASRCPSDGEEIAVYPKGGVADVDLAVAAAKAAFADPTWSKPHASQDRAALLRAIAQGIRDNADHISEVEARDSGKTITDVSLVDVQWAADCFDYFADLATQIYGEVIPVPGDVLDIALREPLGVCSAIVAWNYPIMFAAWKIAPCLAAGNTMVFKPASHTSLSALELANIMSKVGAPAGVVNIVTGPGSEIGEAICNHPEIEKVSFTGSTSVGKKVMQMASSTIKKVTLELGGKSPNIFFDDFTNLEAAVGAAMLGMYFNAGQTCIAGSRVFVHENIYDAFKSELVRRVGNIPVGHCLDYDTRMGAIISEGQMNAILNYIELGKQEGANLLIGGHRMTEGALSKGYFIAPTVFECDRDDYTIMQEEIFGPVLCLCKFSTEEEVIERANNTIYGLASAVWTLDIKRAFRVAKALKAGQVWINQYLMISNFAPHGGFKQSGFGKDLSKYAIDGYTQIKNIYVELCDDDAYMSTFE